jgi:hypothetical protein
MSSSVNYNTKVGLLTKIQNNFYKNYCSAFHISNFFS